MIVYNSINGLCSSVSGSVGASCLCGDRRVCVCACVRCFSSFSVNSWCDWSHNGIPLNISVCMLSMYHTILTIRSGVLHCAFAELSQTVLILWLAGGAVRTILWTLMTCLANRKWTHTIIVSTLVVDTLKGFIQVMISNCTNHYDSTS